MTRNIDPGLVVGLWVFPSGDATVVRKKTVISDGIPPDYDRAVTYLSPRSRANMLFTLKNSEVIFRSMFCLSYPAEFPTNGVIVKKHLNTWLTWFRRNYRQDLYFWFLEFQRRGAPHVHLYLTGRKSTYEQHRMAMAWALTICPTDWKERKKVYRVHNHPRQFQDFKTRDGYIHYATKYALKTHQKAVPRDFQHVGRFWGCSRQVRDKIPAGEYVEMTEHDLRDYLGDIQHRCEDWQILPKIIFDCFT